MTIVNSSESSGRFQYFRIVCVLYVVILWTDRTDGNCPEMCQCMPLFTSLKITCVNKHISAIPASINEAVHSLDLSNNMIDAVTFKGYYFEQLYILNLSRNIITKIYDLTKSKTLQYLDLSDNKITDVSAINDLPNLIILDISKNPINNLEQLKNGALTHLDANECEISYLNPTSISSLPKLTRLSLKYNPLKLIHYPMNTNLKSLDVSHCDIKFLEQNAFQKLPNLEKLILTNNSQMEFVRNKSTSITHSNLRLLDISHCNWNRYSLKGLPKLKTAILSNNKLAHINADAFSENHELRVLLLNNNGIKYVNEHSFINSKNLQILDLSHNRISEIYRNTFVNNVLLKVLNLSHNALQEVADLTALNVTSLDLSSNEVRHFDRNQLVRLPQMRHLNLSDNDLEQFPRILNSVNLETLNLKHNRISIINRDNLYSLPKLRRLILSENELKEPFDASVFENNLEMINLDLSRNPWNCNCRKMKSLYTYLSNLHNSSLVKTLCFTPYEKNGYSWKNACLLDWLEEQPPVKSYTPKTMNFIVIALLILLILCGSIVSIRHTIKMRRIEIHRQANSERAEIRERLRRLQRRNQQLEEEAINHLSEQRINPLELIGPPSYEEAVDMARLTRSLDTLNNLGVENTPVTQALGSVDNLRSKRRARRPKKRTPSDDNLAKRETRREIRLKRNREQELYKNASNSVDNALPVTEIQPRLSVAFDIPHSSSEKICSSSDGGRRRPPTPITRKRKRLKMVKGPVTTTDDEASDNEIDVANKRDSNGMTIKNLRAEPRRGEMRNN